MTDEEYLTSLSASDQAQHREWLAMVKGAASVTDPRLSNDAPLPAPRATPKAPEPLLTPTPEPIREIGADDCEEGLSIKQMTAVDCILRGLSQQRTSEVVGVTRRTVCEWVKKPAFVKVIRARRKGMLASSMNLLQSSSVELATTLITLAKNPVVDPADRIRASVSALKMAQEQVVVEEIAERLDRIEQSRKGGSSEGATFTVVEAGDD